MLYALKRHPVPMAASFGHCLVVTYALPETRLIPLLPPGLELDTYRGMGLVAVAMVQARRMRPAGFPSFLGRDFFLAGYRIFARYHRPSGRTIRGLRILASHTDASAMRVAGNLLTHYGYRRVGVELREEPGLLEIRTGPADAPDLHVRATLAGEPAPLPEGTIFATEHDARRFAGPLPFTFDYEPETHSIILIKGVRESWNPRPVRVEVLANRFFDAQAFRGVKPILSSAFHVAGVDYRWERGVREPLTEPTR